MNDINELWDYDDPAGSETRFRAWLAQAAGQPDVRLELLTQIARAQGLQSRFNEAHATLDEVEAKLAAAGTWLRVRYLLERGRVHNSAGHADRARPLFAQALDLAQPDPTLAFYAIDAAHMLGIVAPPDEQLAWNRRALAMADAAEDARARGWRGSLLNNLGWTYHAAGDFPAALDAFESALAFRRAQLQEGQGSAEAERIARWCVARVRRDLGQVAAALAEQQALLAEYDTLAEPSGYVYREIAECLRLLGDEAAARAYFALAEELGIGD